MGAPSCVTSWVKESSQPNGYIECPVHTVNVLNRNKISGNFSILQCVEDTTSHDAEAQEMNQQLKNDVR